MKILGEELGRIGRWYLALPPILLIGFLIGLFFLAAAGQTRLNMANERAHRSQLREQALNEFAGLITDAESAQRGYLLTAETRLPGPLCGCGERGSGRRSIGCTRPMAALMAAANFTSCEC